MGSWVHLNCSGSLGTISIGFALAQEKTLRTLCRKEVVKIVHSGYTKGELQLNHTAVRIRLCTEIVKLNGPA